MFLESVGGHIPSTDPILGPNDHIRSAVSLDSHAPELFSTLTHWSGRQRADSVTRFDLARTSALRPPRSSATRRSASRQSSLPINRDCQHTATNYCIEVGHTRSTRAFFASHKLLK